MADDEIIATRSIRDLPHDSAESGPSSPDSADAPMGATRAPVKPSLKRAVRMLAMTTFLPGRAQVFAGPRPLGRVAVIVTLACWVAIAAGIIGLLVNRGAVLNTLLAPGLSQVICVVLVLLAIGWALLYAATVRAAKPARLGTSRGVLVGVVALLLTGLTSGSLVGGAYVLSQARGALDIMFQAGTSVEPVNGRYNILLLGGDAGSDRTGRRPDSISVLSIDAATGASATFSIPRNLQNAPFPDGSPMKSVYPDGYNCGDSCIINSLYGLVNQKYTSLYPGVKDPGAKAMMETASEILGIQVNSYVLVDMGGFSEMVDAMGGVTVTSGGWVPITSGEIPGTNPVRHYPPSEWMRPGTLHLDGYHAEWFARSREFTSDYNRIKRQQCIQESMIRQMTPAKLLTHFGSIATASANLVESNIDRGQAGTFIDAALSTRGQAQAKLTIGEPDFPALFSTYPDFDQVHTRVTQVINGLSTTTATAEGTGSGASTVGMIHAAPLALSIASTVGLPTAEPASLPAKDVAPDGTKVTPEYLNQLAKNWDDATLGDILSDNGNCTPGS
jgi:LCP family protein required for cell wall assembly